MRTHHPDNKRVKRRYFIFLKEAQRQNEASVDAVAKAISRFEAYTKWRDFKAFHFEQAVGFKAHLLRCRNAVSGSPLSKATMNSALRALKVFFQWLAMQPGYKSRLNYTDMEYFNLSQKDARIAIAKRLRPIPTLEQPGIDREGHHFVEPLAKSLDGFQTVFGSDGLNRLDGFDGRDFLDG